MGLPRPPAWLPNAISVARVLLVPVWVVLAELANRAGESPPLTAEAEAWRAWAFATLLTIGLSDVLDGWLARRFGLQSHLGANLDAFADKLAQVVLFTYLALRTGPAFAAVPLWLLALLIARDAVIVLGYALIRRRRGRVEAEHRAHGKIASLLLFGLLLLLSAGRHPAPWLLAAIAATVALSTALYARCGVQQFFAPR
ncbi:MAG: CDP-alcohol phosphatidyltransferase family protein [Planctomycetes bacterium]|nr:CDP-alcohol phosphatidyltransferase family protein [Planctomycetota bacterium]